MQRSDRWPENYDPDTPRSRPGSRRNSASSRRGSIKNEKEQEKKKSPISSATNSSSSTPKKVQKPQNLDFVVTGKQITKRYDRANSLPGSGPRRPSTELNKRRDVPAKTQRSRDTSIDDDMSLDLSQVSDFEDTNSKYGVKPKPPLATSTPKSKLRSGSLQAHISRMESSKNKSRDSTSSREDSFYRTSSSITPYSKYSQSYSISPDYSGQSSGEMSPGLSRRDMSAATEMQVSTSSCTTSWMDGISEDTKVPPADGEWSEFWANYNGTAPSKVQQYYDQCPTPYRSEDVDLGDLDFTLEGSRKRSPDSIQNINQIIRGEGLHLTPKETQNIIKCAHILGDLLTKAIERRAREKADYKIEEIQPETQPEREIIKQTLTLDLKETNLPLEVKEEKRQETVTTQTDISLPNTKSAPRIFENILRQLSRSSIDEGSLPKVKKEANAKEEKEKEEESAKDKEVEKTE